MPIVKAHPVPSMGFQSKVEQACVYMVTYTGQCFICFVFPVECFAHKQYPTKRVPVFTGCGIGSHIKIYASVGLIGPAVENK